MLHREGLHDLFDRGIDAANKGDLLHQLIPDADDPVPEVICGDDPDSEDEQDEGDDAETGECNARNIPGEVTQDIIDPSKEPLQDNDRDPHGDHHEKTGDEVFLYKILQIFHVVILLILPGACKLFFGGNP